MINSKVTTDGSGTATFAVGVEGVLNNLKTISLRVDGKAITLPSDQKLQAGHIYNIARWAVPEGAVSGKFTINNSTDGYYYNNYDFTDWGATMGSGWRTPSRYEWDYVLKTRSASTVNGTAHGRFAKATVAGKAGLIIFPDIYMHPDGVGAPKNVNKDDADYNGNTYDAAAWTEMEYAGCVFLPAAGNRNGTTMNHVGSIGNYWTSTKYNSHNAYKLKFASSEVYSLDDSESRSCGYSVRLVRAVE